MGPWELQALPPVYSLPMGIGQRVHIIAVPLSSRRPAQVGRQIMAADICLARECNYAQKNSPTPTNGLVDTTHVWLQSVRCVLSLGRAGSVHTVCSGTLPTLGRIAARLRIDSTRKLGPCKSNDTVVPSVVSLVPAGGGASRRCACTA
jgi:hypothetical protein